MNILHLSAVKAWGGGENHIENLCHEIGKIDSRQQNYILCVKNSPFHKRLKAGNFNIFSAPLILKFDLRYVLKIHRIVRKHKIDLIHIHDSTALTLAVMAIKLGALPAFILSKKTSFPIKNRKRTLYKYNHPNIKKILCVSEKTKEITSEMIQDKNKLTTVYHGTDFSRKNLLDFDLRAELGLPKEKVIVGMVANHIRAKNLDTFLELVYHIVHKRKETRFHFVQIGSYTDRSKTYFDKTEKLNISEFISFLGFIQNASGLIPQFDISLLTSQSEGVPQFIFESFYYKTPVVSTNVGGIPEIIVDGENAMLCDAGNVSCLAEKLIALQDDKELQEKFKELSFNKLIKNFSTRNMAERTLAEYKKVLYGKN